VSFLQIAVETLVSFLLIISFDLFRLRVSRPSSQTGGILIKPSNQKSVQGLGAFFLCEDFKTFRKTQIKTSFIWFSARFALLLSFIRSSKLGCASEKSKKIWFFAQLALTLSPDLQK